MGAINFFCFVSRLFPIDLFALFDLFVNPPLPSVQQLVT